MASCNARTPPNELRRTGFEASATRQDAVAFGDELPGGKQHGCFTPFRESYCICDIHVHGTTAGTLERRGPRWRMKADLLDISFPAERF